MRKLKGAHSGSTPPKKTSTRKNEKERRCSKYPIHNNRKWETKHINAHLRKRNQILSIKITTTRFSHITIGSICEISMRNEKI